MLFSVKPLLFCVTIASLRMCALHLNMFIWYYASFVVRQNFEIHSVWVKVLEFYFIYNLKYSLTPRKYKKNFEYEYYNTTFLIWLITEIQYVHQILLLHKTQFENRLLCSSYNEKAMIFRTKAKMKIKFEISVCILYKRFQILIFKLNALLTFQRTDSSKENVTRVMN